MILYNNVFSGGKTQDNIVKVTYAELAALGAAKKFDTKVIYQLTDFTISNNWEENKGVKLASLNHLYDILIAPISNEYLSANCAATMHDGETYFTEIELSQWKIKYGCIYSFILPFFYNINKGNPKGTIFELTDESNNTCNFDFKNITFNGNLIYGMSYPDPEHGKTIIDASRNGVVTNNRYYIYIKNISQEDLFGGLMCYNSIIENGYVSRIKTNTEEDDSKIIALNNVNLYGSEIRINSNQSDLFLVNFNAYQAMNILIKGDVTSIENVEINNCTDCVINNVEYINNTTFQFLNAKTVDLEPHLNQRLIVTPTEDKIKIIS